MDAGLKKKFAHMLAEQLVIACPNAYSLATMSHSNSEVSYFKTIEGGDGQTAEDIAAVAAAGLLKIIQDYAKSHDVRYLWMRSLGLHYPVAAAAAGNHWKIVELLIEIFMDNVRTNPNAEYQHAFNSAIDIALTRKHTKIALRLLDVYHHNFPVAHKDNVRRWLVKASKCPDKGVYKAVAALRTEAMVEPHIGALKRACMFGEEADIRSIFVHNFLDPNQGYL
jgi:hypothetical protein